MTLPLDDIRQTNPHLAAVLTSGELVRPVADGCDLVWPPRTNLTINLRHSIEVVGGSRWVLGIKVHWHDPELAHPMGFLVPPPDALRLSLVLEYGAHRHLVFRGGAREADLGRKGATVGQGGVMRLGVLVPPCCGGEGTVLRVSILSMQFESDLCAHWKEAN